MHRSRAEHNVTVWQRLRKMHLTALDTDAPQRSRCRTTGTRPLESEKGETRGEGGLREVGSQEILFEGKQGTKIGTGRER
jgi:hypothetical protein